MRNSIIAALCILTGAAWLNTGIAGTMSTSGTVSNFHYILTDLDPNDGIAPTLTFFDFPFPSYSSVRTMHTNDDGNYLYLANGADEFGAVSDAYAGAGYQQSGSVSGGDTLQTLVLSASAQANVAGTFGIDMITTAAPAILGFYLGPHTGVEFVADASLSAFSSGRSDGAELAFSGTTAWLGFTIGDSYLGDKNTSPGAVVMDRLGNADARLPKTATVNQTMTLSYDNLSGVAERGVVSLNVSAGISQYPLLTPPVPEPAAWSMLSAGLLLGALRGRRRRVS